jgi:hypothetical protein
MGVDLIRGKRRYHVNAPTWWATLTVAIGCGWNPTGTGPPRGCLKQGRAGGYLTNDGQRCYARDAQRLATVLQSLVDQPSQTEVHVDPKRVARWLRTVQGRQSLIGFQTYQQVSRVINKRYSAKLDQALHTRWLLTYDGRTYLRSLIRFCQGGSFRIF